MLVLSRKVRQQIVITLDTGEVIKIGVAEIRGDKVRIGVEASLKHQVDRGEIWEEKQRGCTGTAPGPLS